MAKLSIHTDEKKSKISRNIYGNFSEHLGRCIYNGIYVGENSDIPNVNGMRTDIVEALKAIKLPVLRWPGGCFADEYHWKDGIGPKETRKKMVNTHWGGVVEDNSFGTHEFLEFCRPLPPLPDLRPRLRRQPRVPHCLRPGHRRRLQLDRRGHAHCRQLHERPQPALLHRAGHI